MSYTLGKYASICIDGVDGGSRWHTLCLCFLRVWKGGVVKRGSHEEMIKVPKADS